LTEHSQRGQARRQCGRFVGVGLLITLVLLLLIGPRLLRGGEHPLAQTASFDLCSHLGPDVWSVLGDVTPRAAVRPGTDPSCIVDAGEPPHQVSLAVVTQALLHRQGGPSSNTRRYVETFIAETQASGWSVTTVQGPWKDGRLLSRANVPSQLQLLAEDDGVVISISAQDVERDALIAFASAVTRRLREQEPE